MKSDSEIAMLTEVLVTHTELTRLMSADLIRLRHLIYSTLLIVGLLLGISVAYNWLYVTERTEAAEDRAAMIEDLRLRLADIKENCL